MKTTKVKGFTLVELIVVIAIFGIIMFGALQLLPSVLKMMVQADVHEGGNAAVSSISTYLENELSTAEYLTAINEVQATTTSVGGRYQLADTQIVEDFVKDYYEGVLKAGSTAESPEYGTGKVHVLMIDNTVEDEVNGIPGGNGKISKFVYDVQFDIMDPDITLDTSEEFAVNRAYYDDYRYEIKAGVYDNNTFDIEDPDSYEGLISNLSTRETVFSIRAVTNRNNTDYSFVSHATMSLINIFNRNGLGVPNVYFVVDETYDTISKTVNKEIVDITKPNLSRYVEDAEHEVSGDIYSFANSRQNGGVTRGSMVKYVEDSTSGYCFIYSYGPEIITE